MKFSENIQQVAGLPPDYMGFIFFEKSPRNFDAEIPNIDKNIKKTGVFVDASIDFILEKVRRHQLQAVQLHGNESPQFCATLKAENLEIIKVFSVKDSFDFDILQEYEGKVDFFLFDTKGKAKGGNGITFDWEVLKKYPSETPFFISGGIGLEEMARLKKFQFPKTFYGIDVNSRFETAPGFKNMETLKKLKRTIPTVKNI
ncbi:phosphoribosylanthranilate isomerase [Salinimicrobium sp. GXAS 041]|uniref:phosphoribosylanthranilate isomerase n=1 Tax=Salinimicrobium sp. GXAS 041 TaxID=3400806 RepID=UPI003C774CCA